MKLHSAVSAAAVSALAVGAALFAAHRAVWDFDMFWYAGRHWWAPYAPDLMHTAEAQETLHASTTGVPLGYPYPPVLLLLLVPLGLLPVKMAWAIWSGLWAGLFAYLVSLRAQWAALLLVFSIPMFYAAYIGQTGLMISCAVLGAFMLLPDRPKLAGALLAVVCCIKPQSALMAPFVLWGRWDAVKGAVIAGTTLILASLVLGPHLWIDWLHVVTRFSGEMGPIVPKISPRLLFPNLGWTIALATVGIAFACLERGVLGFAVGTLLCSPYFQMYDLALFGLFGAVLVADWARAGPLPGAAPGLLGLVLILCPAYPITLTLMCGALIGLWAMKAKLSVAQRLASDTRYRAIP